jgi:hypothetical protein
MRPALRKDDIPVMRDYALGFSSAASSFPPQHEPAGVSVFLSLCATFPDGWLLESDSLREQTPHDPPRFAQYPQLEHVVHAVQLADPVQVPAYTDEVRANANTDRRVESVFIGEVVEINRN